MLAILISWTPIVMGISAVLGAIGSLLTQLSTGQWNGAELAADWSALSAGAGLIFAKAKNVTGGTVAATPEAAKRV
jgi:hypothetical protein